MDRRAPAWRWTGLATLKDRRPPRFVLSALLVLVVAAAPHTQTPSPPNSSNLGSDANGNPLRRALETGHVSNYDESRAT
jgi:hypothetical protein